MLTSFEFPEAVILFDLTVASPFPYGNVDAIRIPINFKTRTLEVDPNGTFPYKLLDEYDYVAPFKGGLIAHTVTSLRRSDYTYYLQRPLTKKAAEHLLEATDLPLAKKLLPLSKGLKRFVHNSTPVLTVLCTLKGNISYEVFCALHRRAHSYFLSSDYMVFTIEEDEFLKEPLSNYSDVVKSLNGVLYKSENTPLSSFFHSLERMQFTSKNTMPHMHYHNRLVRAFFHALHENVAAFGNGKDSVSKESSV